MSLVRRVAAILAILGMVAVGAYVLRHHLLRASASTQALYATAVVTQGSIQADISGSATMQAAQSVTLSAPAAGKVGRVSVHQGDTVQAGQLVAVMEDPQLAQSITQAQLKVHADLETLAAATGTSVSQAQNINPQQGVTVTAPQAGRITELDVATGEQVTAGEVLAKIVDSHTVIMDIGLVPYDHALAADGDAVQVHFDIFSGWVVGTLEHVSANGITSTSGTAETYPAEVVLNNPKLLQPGDQGQVQVRAGGTWLTLPGEYKITSFGKESVVHSPINATAEAVDVAGNAWVTQGTTLFSLGGGSAAAAIAGDELALQQDQASLATLQQEQSALTVTSSLAGVVSAVDVTAGQQVSNGGQIASVYSPQEMTLTLPVSELQVTQVKKGQSVQISTPGLSGKTFTGTVLAVDTVGQSGSGLATFDVQITVDGKGELLPGMTADAQIVTAQASGAMLVPVEAVLQQSSGDEVEVLRQGQVSTVSVKVGLVNSNNAQILSGLTVGETVVTGAATGAIANAVSAALSAKPGGGAGGGKAAGTATATAGGPPAAPPPAVK